ncbi:ABC-type Mn/Zn transport system, ATPase component [Halalkaliarchaeum sp. AArc-CO]|uniref:metal ABC transporter ATP-binding protein n=1 Tax=Halalkaliarchaeum sp. AArc-CO TaxID=2866381 RepID=UPI00217CED46|nr:metal ABC transporter ATP-binding protein [Halalkaliarchaeum sp. AArc-CO]UWG51727.1 ABC-type Mn/Zn transport system, ATPase component [Halalkaliarchaeum sp. AArc-CO]
MSLIAVENVSFGYTASPVVTDISFHVDPGEYVGIIGPNGSGKSTLLQLILGLHNPDEGSVRLFGHPAREFVERERVGYVAQDVTENTKQMPITVAEVVLMGRFPHTGFGRVGAKDRELTRKALRTVGIEHLADRRITKLSGGQRQRAYIARALAGEADLLVLDEPTVGVDAESVDAFFDLLSDLNDEGMTILLVEHDIGAVLEHTERVLCLNRELYFDGPPVEFAESDALDRAFGTNVRRDDGVTVA